MRFMPEAKSRHDMLGSFIRHEISQEQASGEALLQVVAGSDTSAGTLRSVMLGPMTNPNAHRKLQLGIDERIKAGSVSSPIRDSEARQLPYFQATTREGLRLMPPASGAFDKEVPPAGDTIDGKFIRVAHRSGLRH
jgi:cytochrome P450